MNNIDIYTLLKKCYYKLIETLLSDVGMVTKVNNYKFRFSPRHYRWFPQDYEKSSIDYLSKCLKRGGECIDIGSHFGLYTIILAKYFKKKVYSFEPTPYSFSILKKNVIYNHLAEDVDARQNAVSSKQGVVNFMIQETDGSVANSLVDYHHSDEKKFQIQVETVTLDSLFADREIDFIKIDVEGVEYDVLLGAEILISRQSPLIMLGLHPRAIQKNGQSLKLIWDWFRNKNYRCMYNNKEISEQEFCEKDEIFDVFLLK